MFLLFDLLDDFIDTVITWNKLKSEEVIDMKHTHISTVLL